MRYALAAMLLVATAVLADEPAAPAEPAPVPKMAPGEVYSVDKEGKPVKVDLNKLQIQQIEWFELGLRGDGTVMWRRK